LLIVASEIAAVYPDQDGGGQDVVLFERYHQTILINQQFFLADRVAGREAPFGISQSFDLPLAASTHLHFDLLFKFANLTMNCPHYILKTNLCQ
jgi:hypothetical protein